MIIILKEKAVVCSDLSKSVSLGLASVLFGEVSQGDKVKELKYDKELLLHSVVEVNEIKECNAGELFFLQKVSYD